MTDLELHNWALERYGSEDLAKKLAIVQQLHRDEHAAADRFVVVLKHRHASAAPLGWFGTLASAKAALGERAGLIWNYGRGAPTGGEKVYEQT